MKRNIKSLDNLVQISEELVREAITYIPEDEESGLRTAIGYAEEYKAANLTPIFILDQYNMDVLVVCKETFGKRLH